MASLLRILWVMRLVSSLIVFASRSPPFITSSPVCCRSHTTWRTDQWHSAVISSSFPLTSCENTSLVHSLIPIPFQSHSNPIPVSFQYLSSLIPTHLVLIFNLFQSHSQAILLSFFFQVATSSFKSVNHVSQSEGRIPGSSIWLYVTVLALATQSYKNLEKYSSFISPHPPSQATDFNPPLASFPGAFIIDQ